MFSYFKMVRCASSLYVFLRNTGENLKRVNELEKYGVKLENIYTVTIDSGSNVLNAMKLMNEEK